MYNGVINVYKEKGFTSFDVIAKMRGILKQKKIGHTGTLDPDAVGVLPVCLGSATRLCDMLTDWTKEYEADFLFGKTTDTQDISGKVLSEAEVTITEDAAKEIICGFVGEYNQIPPMYSARKINGKKLYELAREGKEVERKPVMVHIDEITILEIKMPVVRIRVQCSKGTYIRTLCHDIGEKAGCGAVMTALKRTRVGMFSDKEAFTLDQIEAFRDKGCIEAHMIAVDEIFTKLPNLKVKDEFVKRVQNGNILYFDQIECPYLFQKKGEEVKVYDGAKNFYGVYGFCPEEKGFRPVKMFLENKGCN